MNVRMSRRLVLTKLISSGSGLVGLNTGSMLRRAAARIFSSSGRTDAASSRSRRVRSMSAARVASWRFDGSNSCALR
jgi:hypothetical protein